MASWRCVFPPTSLLLETQSKKPSCLQSPKDRIRAAAASSLGGCLMRIEKVTVLLLASCQ